MYVYYIFEFIDPMEKLLAKEDIDEILKNYKESPVFKYNGVRLLTTGEHSFKEVIAVSDKNRLILIKGNEDTGNQHIRERHDYWSTKIYTKINDNEEIVFQNQSRFPRNTYPYQYLKIADEIYLKENLVVNNHHPQADKFDLYIGEYLFEESKNEKVKLLLYKGTKIIHSLFLAHASYNKKRVKKFPFSRGQIKFKINQEKGTMKTLIPYLDIAGNRRYGIEIEKFPEQKLMNILILIFISGNYEYYHYLEIGESELVNFKSLESERITYQHCDLREFERIILEIDLAIESGKIKLDKR